MFRTNEDHLILQSIKACSVSGDIDGVEQYIDKFREHSEHMQVRLPACLHYKAGDL